MSRAARLISIVEHLRARRLPVTADDLARAFDTSPRTIYRDIATLQGQGALIEGEAGIGYVLRDGYFLPPLNFTADEAEALLLGLKLVQDRGGSDLASAAAIARGKIEAVLPAERLRLEDPAIDVPGRSRAATATIDSLRSAIRSERKVQIAYRDKGERETRRIVWPLVVGLFDATDMLAAWCEMRGDFRHFRLDRIVALEATQDALPRRRRQLLAEWRDMDRAERPR